MKQNLQPESLCVHAGAIKDTQFGGVNTPIYTSSAFDYRNGTLIYPRNNNTPNQRVVAARIAALEKGEAGLLFSSGMAAIYTAMMAVVKAGEHVIFQADLYGGTQYMIRTELIPQGIDCTLVDGSDVRNFEAAIRPNTKAIYIETPSNPLLKIVDIAGVAALAKASGLVTMIDNTFASPINQNPITFGIDLVLHSGAKYLGGHSDILFGVAVGSAEWIARLHAKSLVYGGNLNGDTCALIDRSLKTLAVRVQRHNENALAVAQFMEDLPMVRKVYYPGLPSNEGFALAQKQMHGFGGMLSFELRINHLSDIDLFLDTLKIITPAVSLGGVESLITSPRLTSHANVPLEEREKMGITDGLLRLSVGIEALEDLKTDLLEAIQKVELHSLIA
jgi:cystathionine beta-lyase/cystathionine gamma-synthase